ncbi:MAG: hypothetical protein ABJF10_12445 [Chthoniobacter sp.]|uniref:glycine zipper domain-containing protein n=1 Tax=Chthoniobacter sp. TaxID=2510640 RepID=UPI0032AE2899
MPPEPLPKRSHLPPGASAEAAVEYLESPAARPVPSSVESYIRENPLKAAAVALVVGIVVGRSVVR